MTPLPRSPRAPRSFGIAATAFVLAASAAACGSSPKDVWYLYPVDAGASQPDATPDQEAPPVPSTLTVTACSSGALVGADVASVVRSVSLLGDRAVIAAAGAVSAWRTDDTGCPVQRIETFGENGEVALEASSAAAVPGGRVLATTAQSTLLLSADGQTVGPCQQAGQDVIARSITIGGDGKGVAVFARSPLYPVSTDLAWPDACDMSQLGLLPEPFAVASAARFRDLQVDPPTDHWITVEQRLASSPLVVSWYDQYGTLLASSSTWAGQGQPGHLCSATAFVATRSSVIVADSACNALVVFDSTTQQPIARATLDGTPRGVTLTAAGEALVPVARPIGDGAVATFVLVDLP